MIRKWYYEIEKKLHMEQLFCAKPCEKCFLQIAIPELEEYTGSATVSKEDVPVLLQYYNPIVAPHFSPGTELETHLNTSLTMAETLILEKLMHRIFGSHWTIRLR